MTFLPGRTLKVAADKLRRDGLVERIERGPFDDPGYRLTLKGIDEVRRFFEKPAGAGGEARP